METNKKLVDKDVLSEKGLLEKVATIKRFEYSPLDSELEEQTDIVGKKYRGFKKFHGFDKKQKYDTINKEEKIMINTDN